MGHVLGGPHGRELGAGRFHPPDEAGPGRVPDVMPVGRAQLGHQRRPLVGPVFDRAAAVGPGEQVQQRVPLLRRGLEHAREQHLVGGVPGQDVEPLGHHAGRQRAQPVQDDLDLRPQHRAALVRVRRVRHLGQPEQVLPLDRVQLERPGHRLEHLHAGPDRAALLEPGVPGHPHAGQLRHLLTAQPGRPAPVPAGQPGVLRRDPLAPAAQERRQLMTPLSLSPLASGPPSRRLPSLVAPPSLLSPVTAAALWLAGDAAPVRLSHAPPSPSARRLHPACPRRGLPGGVSTRISSVLVPG